MNSTNTFNTKRKLVIQNENYNYFSISALEEFGLKNIPNLPFSLKILLENLLRFEDNKTVRQEDIKAIAEWSENKKSDKEIAYRPARVLMQDFTGVPAVADLAAMRDAIHAKGGDYKNINPLTPVDLVIDHSVQVDTYGTASALHANAKLEYERNHERYAFLRWGQHAFNNFRVVPPETGICHQVNLEYLSKTIICNEDKWIYPDTLVGTDSHTTMVNGLGVLGWGVGGIEAEAAMLGQPISMLIPEVIGVKLIGYLQEGVTATDMVLHITHQLRKKGVVGKFVEFFGPGLQSLPVADRATIANMAPEYGATCGYFPIDQETIKYLCLTGREEKTIALVEAYAKAQGLWYDGQDVMIYTDTLEIDISNITSALAGPKRPQDKVILDNLHESFTQLLKDNNKIDEKEKKFETNADFTMRHGDVVIAAITSCTNTSNPAVLMAAGLLAKKAVERGLKTKNWVKTSLAPGSKVVTTYLEKTGLQKFLDQLGFETVGYGCTTCIGNSGPLSDDVSNAIAQHDLLVSAVISGNRNFEGRIHPQVKANWLASPPLVVAFALAGTTCIDLLNDPIAEDSNGRAVYLKEIWPSNAEIAEAVAKVNSAMFVDQYADVFKGDDAWQQINIPESQTYAWQPDSTYIQHPPFFKESNNKKIETIKNARILALFGDSITTDHISPAGSIKADSPAGKYLLAQGVTVKDFNSYGARRGNHEVMVRGTFANIRIKNEILNGIEGGFTKHFPDGEVMSIYDAAMKYKSVNTPLVIVAGKEYGTGSSRDWAAKGPKLQGIRVVIAESFERIHRSNLIGMGILPLQFETGVTRKTLHLKGDEIISFDDLNDTMQPKSTIHACIQKPDGTIIEITLISRIDTTIEMAYYRHGGILNYVLQNLTQQYRDI